MRKVNRRTLDHVSRRIDYEAEAAMIAKERYPIPSLVIVNAAFASARSYP
jgi:hypothetical protein